MKVFDKGVEKTVPSPPSVWKLGFQTVGQNPTSTPTDYITMLGKFQSRRPRLSSHGSWLGFREWAGRMRDVAHGRIHSWRQDRRFKAKENLSLQKRGRKSERERTSRLSPPHPSRPDRVVCVCFLSVSLSLSGQQHFCTLAPNTRGGPMTMSAAI